MSKSKKIAVSIISGFIGLILLLYLTVCYFSAKPGMNGFAVTNGMIRLLISGKEYVKVGEDRYLYHEGYLKEIVENEYDSYTFVDSYCDSEWDGRQPDLEEVFATHFYFSDHYIAQYGLVEKDGELHKGVSASVWSPLVRVESIYYRPFDEN